MKKVLVLLLVFTMVFSSMVFAGKPEEKKNNRADVVFYEEYQAKLVMKTSKGWIPMAHQDPGDWLTNHWEWYSNELPTIENDYGWAEDNVNIEFGTGEYIIKSFTKYKAIDDKYVTLVPYLNEKGVLVTSEGVTDWGQDVIWNNIVIIHDVLDVYNAETGELVMTINLDETNAHPGFGNLKFAK